jgi:hypothetical protein
MLGNVDWPFVTDVSGQSLSPIYKGQGTQEDWTGSPLKIGPTGCLKTSMTTNRPSVTSQKSKTLINLTTIFHAIQAMT